MSAREIITRRGRGERRTRRRGARGPRVGIDHARRVHPRKCDARGDTSPEVRRNIRGSGSPLSLPPSARYRGNLGAITLPYRSGGPLRRPRAGLRDLPGVCPRGASSSREHQASATKRDPRDLIARYRRLIARVRERASGRELVDRITRAAPPRSRFYLSALAAHWRRARFIVTYERPRRERR